MNGPLRVGIVGMGAAGRRRAKAVAALPSYTLAAVCDPQHAPEAAPGVPWFTEHADLVAADIDVVLVATRNDVATQVVLDALRAGKHVFCEKPAGRSARDTRSMGRAARSSPGRLAFGFNHRQHASVQKAEEIARSGGLGRLLFVRGVYGKSELDGWRADGAVSGGGIFLDQGIHLLDLARRFTGELVEAQAMTANPYWSATAEDNLFALLRSDEGAVVSLHSSATQWQHTFRLELHYTNGALLLDGLATGSASYRAADGRLETLTVRHGRADAQTETFSFDEDDSWEKELSAFAAWLNKDDDRGICTWEDALGVMRQVDLVYDSASATVGLPWGGSRRADAISSYRARLGRMLQAADWAGLETLARLCLDAHLAGNTIYVAGNGGSAATAAHWATDLRHCFPGNRGLRVFALGQNVAFTTAAANDRGFEGVFTEEICETLRPGDVVVVISASGNSPNIVRLLEYTADHGGQGVAVVGFDGGKSAALADLVVHCAGAVGDYGPVEDIHMTLGHALMERVGELARERTSGGDPDAQRPVCAAADRGQPAVQDKRTELAG
ncbi:Gfo/Idh/MocA family oxidoreductase [Streptomyces sp. SID4928]|uniref:Gfo/Idh/MocA family protein n=1 Tax=unclassified Streptomyces TaxID=2593676 RepID=UPI0001C19C27|nr:Gfo/Idh/MocA family oxidoreductase [Streptomyces sp. ACT-1]EGE39619.1 oxidoreductase domain protein [Streptomyces sp. ACT-1]MYR47708.1 Gfo/Idh/MocA family oxidoreductase [Streptomyces sp. SID4928]